MEVDKSYSEYIKTIERSLERQEARKAAQAQRPVQRPVNRYPSKNITKDTFTKKSSQTRTNANHNLHRSNKNNIKLKIAAALAAIGITTTGIAVANSNRNINNDEFIVNSSYSESYNNESQIDDVNIFNSAEATKSPEEIALDILEKNPEVKEQYNKLSEALDRLSKHLGTDARKLIKERVQELGNKRVDPIDVAKILWIESKGRIYTDDGELIESNCGAIGPFQIMPDAESFVNDYYDLTGTDEELDYKNPYDNLDLCILNLRYINYKRGEDLKEGVPLQTGDNLKDAVAWSYHDGAWAENLSEFGRDYVAQYQTLSKIDKYPEVIDYLFNN